MKSSKFIAATTLSSLAIFITSCSEHYDDPKYRSMPPSFSDMTFTNLNGESTMRTGERIVATAVQSSIGRLLNRTTYTWSTSPTEGISHAFVKSVVYDQETQNPTDTLVFTIPGTYTVTLTAKYNSSGNNQSIDNTVEFTDGSVTYVTNGLLSYSVTVKKTVKIE